MLLDTEQVAKKQKRILSDCLFAHKNTGPYPAIKATGMKPEVHSLQYEAKYTAN